MSQKEIDRLNVALMRLMEENKQTRLQIEEAKAIIRRRAPNADGLSLVSAAKIILDDRDATADRVQIFRNELVKALKLLLANQLGEAVKQLNHFLFHNPR